MRVLIITEDDSLYAIQFFNSFFPAIPSSIKLVGITVPAAFNESFLSTARRMLRFCGFVDFTRLCLRYASAKIRRRSIARLADVDGLPMIDTSSVNDSAYLG